MSDDPKKKLPTDSTFEMRVLDELSEIRGQLTKIEEKVDSGLSESRAIWEAVEQAIKHLDMKFDIVIRELYDVRADAKFLDKRITELEAR